MIAATLGSVSLLLPIGRTTSLALVMAALREPELFRALVLYEPIIFPPESRRPDAPKSPLADGARRRRTNFASFDEALANYSAKPPLNVFHPECLEAYVRHGFRETTEFLSPPADAQPEEEAGRDDDEFLRQAPEFERHLARSGIHLIKFWFSVSRAEQRRRFKERKAHPLKQWKLSSIDIDGLGKWDAYCDAIDETMEKSHFDYAPWTVILSDDKLRARIAAFGNHT